MNTYSRLAAAVVVVIAVGGAIYFLNSPGGLGPGGPTVTPAASATPRPTTTIVEAGTITLTDSGCTWEGKPDSITKGDSELRIQFSVRNETDTFGNFGVFRLDTGTWDEAAVFVLGENAALHGGPSQPPQDFATEVSSVDAAERNKTYPAGTPLLPGTYGIICSSNEPPPGLVFAVYLIGPLEIDGN